VALAERLQDRGPKTKPKSHLAFSTAAPVMPFDIPNEHLKYIGYLRINQAFYWIFKKKNEFFLIMPRIWIWN
jgi:hypothetical protein